MKINSSTDVFLVIDVQRDFCGGGALAVPDGDGVVAPVNAFMQRFRHVVLTQDWHPAHHSSFASSHPDHAPFSQVDMDYGRQTLWPDHCVIGTPGALFHEALDVSRAELILRKGFRPAIDSYSAFFENDHTTPTGLGGYLRERGFSRIICAGLAFDYCVRYSAQDARHLGFEVVVLDDLCRAIDLGGSGDAARAGLAEAGVEVCASGR